MNYFFILHPANCICVLEGGEGWGGVGEAGRGEEYTIFTLSVRPSVTVLFLSGGVSHKHCVLTFLVIIIIYLFIIIIVIIIIVIIIFSNFGCNSCLYQAMVEK